MQEIQSLHGMDINKHKHIAQNSSVYREWILYLLQNLKNAQLFAKAARTQHVSQDKLILKC